MLRMLLLAILKAAMCQLRIAAGPGSVVCDHRAEGSIYRVPASTCRVIGASLAEP